MTGLRPSRRPTPSDPIEMRAYTGDAIAFPLGGLGTGQVSLRADGSLDQWQIHNQVNHRAVVPDTGFAIRASCIEPPRNVRRLLRAAPRADDARAAPRPSPVTTDHIAPPWPAIPAEWQPVGGTSFEAAYPYAAIRYEDDELGLAVRVEASTPFAPHDVAASSLPLIEFTFSLENETEHRQHGFLVATLLNTVGWDGVTPLDGSGGSLLGGNVNRVRRNGTALGIVMDNPGLDERDPTFGSQMLWTDAPAFVLPRAASLRDVLRWVDSLKLLGGTITDEWDDASLRRWIASSVPTVRVPVGPSPAGRSWLGALACAYALAPGERAEISMVHAWSFPNRVINFDQFGPQGAPSGAWLGNGYAAELADAGDAIATWLGRRAELERVGRSWARSFAGTDLPDAIERTVTQQPALVRSPSLFVDVDGHAFGFEGALGASATNWNGDVGGSCPLNCSHVWNYAQTVAALFPSLERSMRDLEWDHLQGPDGLLAHRVRLPLDGPQLGRGPIGGPVDPALDGMLGAVLKTYREARASGDRAWLERRWSHMVRLVDGVTRDWADGDGVLHGLQPVTFDIAIDGPNMFVGSLWLAVLRTMEAVGRRLGRDAETATYGDRFRSAAAAYDELLWNGEYYGHLGQGAAHDYGDGCLSDQLIGQWWAHLLDLGPLLPADHRRDALRSVVRHNLRSGFDDFPHAGRPFVDGTDRGLLVCTWPRGGRPAVPIRYADEVWTGTEYAVAALCLFEGLEDEARQILDAVLARADGRRRNPFNEIECGDHYARAMSGWSLLSAATGVSHDALDGSLRLGSRVGRYPFVTGGAWGTIDAAPGSITVRVLDGRLLVDSVSVAGEAIAPGDLRVVDAAGYGGGDRDGREPAGWLVVGAGAALAVRGGPVPGVVLSAVDPTIRARSG